MPRRLIVPLIAAFALVPAASAHAGWFPATPLDGPNAEVVSVGGVDLARDGTGAVGYLRMADGVPHAHVARLSDGVWGGPERIDFVAAEATEVKVAAGDGNRLAVAWIAGGTVYATVSPGGATPAGFVPPVAVGGPGAEDIDIDLGVNGAAYVVWQQAGNVHAARLQDSTWTTVAAPLDIDPAREAGTGLLRPRVAVSAEGYAVATWGERHADGSTHVWGRRITGMNLSAVPQDLTLPDGSADSPDIDIEDDGSFAWIVYRQLIGGVPRTLGRRLRRLDVRGARVHRRRQRLRRAGRRHERRRPRPGHRLRRWSAGRLLARPRPLPARGADGRRRRPGADEARGVEHGPRRHRGRLATDGPGRDVGRARPLQG